VNEPALALEGVHVRYPGSGSSALSDVTLAVAHGERVALLGLNGSGKTTLLLAVVGLVPFTGRITVGGQPVEKRTLEEVRRRVGFLFSVPDDQVLFPRVLDDVAFGLRGRGVPREQSAARAMAALTDMGAAHLAEASPHRLSLGQRKRVALAGTLVTDPVLLLLDEPSGGLDPRGCRELERALEAFPGGVLMATHDFAFAERTCARVVVLGEGRVVADEPVTPGGALAWLQRVGV
jgi:energy-coupling factor transporter ATP-binding protein EcfA2